MADGLAGSSQPLRPPLTLDLSSWPLIFVSNTHFEIEDLHEFEDDLTSLGARLTHDIHEAEIVLSRVIQKKRARFDLREKGLLTEEIEDYGPSSSARSGASNKRKRETVEETSGEKTDTASENEGGSVSGDEAGEDRHGILWPRTDNRKTIAVAKTDWLADSKRLGNVQKINGYIVYQGTVVEPKPIAKTTHDALVPSMGSEKHSIASRSANASKNSGSTTASSIIQRAQEDVSASSSKTYDRFHKRKFGTKAPPGRDHSSWGAGKGTSSQHAHLLQETTTEHEDGASSDVPEPPEWVKAGVKYACQRLTPANSPNQSFIDQLKKIKLARLLTNDEIGVRAYSTSIASLAAYTYKIRNPREILMLPGCERKIANLFVEWSNTGKIQAVEDLEEDGDLEVLKTFYNIWGVGSTTAREFYYDKGWGDLDDVIEHGWNDLSRVQKIGVKYYDEFLDSIPRAEVEQIGQVIHKHAVKVRDSGIQSLLVGGYRRGKKACGDVDIIVTHHDEGATLNLVEDIVNSLEEEDWITHTLTISLHSTERNQQTLPYRTGGGGHGFDTLDKALVVWQNPVWPSKEHDLARDPKAKNPNIHRRVDIIVSPWRTAGCAVVGWSGGNTFERDLRRYAKNVKSFKFDSSGVRDRRNGEVVDVEGFHEWKGQAAPECQAKTMEEAEKRVFESFGLTYREPWERCTD